MFDIDCLNASHLQDELGTEEDMNDKTNVEKVRELTQEQYKKKRGFLDVVADAVRRGLFISPTDINVESLEGALHRFLRVNDPYHPVKVMAAIFLPEMVFVEGGENFPATPTTVEQRNKELEAGHLEQTREILRLNNELALVKEQLAEETKRANTYRIDILHVHKQNALNKLTNVEVQALKELGVA